jgi:hypothetical protein
MASEPLNILEAEILYVIWKRKTLGDGTPMTASEIEDELAKRGRPRPTAWSRVAVNKALQRLRKRPEAVLEATEVSPTRSGPRPSGYRLADRKLITWRTTAAVILALYNYPDHEPPDRKRFLEYIAAQKLANDKTGDKVLPQDIDEALAFCREHGYVSDDPSGRLRASPRVDAELPYLKAILSDERDAKPGKGRLDQ